MWRESDTKAEHQKDVQTEGETEKGVCVHCTWQLMSLLLGYRPGLKYLRSNSDIVSRALSVKRNKNEATAI